MGLRLCWDEPQSGHGNTLNTGSGLVLNCSNSIFCGKVQATPTDGCTKYPATWEPHLSLQVVSQMMSLSSAMMMELCRIGMSLEANVTNWSAGFPNNSQRPSGRQRKRQARQVKVKEGGRTSIR